MAYVPHLFIGIGEYQHFYTLRETYEHVSYIGGKPYSEIRSFHHFNLSQDANEAFAKAQAAGDKLALRLTTSRADLDTAMQDIKRANAEELERRAAQAAAWEAERKAMREAAHQEKLDLIDSGVFAFGRFKGETFAEADPSYLEWFADSLPTFEAGSLLQYTALAILRLVPDRLPAKADPNATLGYAGERIETPVTVTKQVSFYRKSFGGYGEEKCYVTTMLTDAKVCLVVISPSFTAKPGDSFVLRGTVKTHREYKGQMQTIVQRAKRAAINHAREAA